MSCSWTSRLRNAPTQPDDAASGLAETLAPASPQLLPAEPVPSLLPHTARFVEGDEPSAAVGGPLFVVVVVVLSYIQ